MAIMIRNDGLEAQIEAERQLRGNATKAGTLTAILTERLQELQLGHFLPRIGIPRAPLSRRRATMRRRVA